ncbi:hypothetical protein LTR09_007463 [Extremus antarcticus]|uniref:Uncharacterized protein n=1 Tax=Extremus antarcticus TaxID=702011 RepID=A0AAJ0DK43_9PEZI|nr:hypothetical protein LTR09_007463 [Extremus antarcticus]
MAGFFSSASRARPSNITSDCTNCGHTIPYDPTNSSGLCQTCNDFAGAGMALNPRTLMEPPRQQQPSTEDYHMHERDFGAPSSNFSFQTPGSHKRKAMESPPYENVPAKRTMLSKDGAAATTFSPLPKLDSGSTMDPYPPTRGPLVRRAVSGFVEPEELTRDASVSDDGDEDAFVDAPEELDTDGDGPGAGVESGRTPQMSAPQQRAGDDPEVVMLEDDDEDEEIGNGDQVDHAPEEDEEEEEDEEVQLDQGQDLFQSTFSKSSEERGSAGDESENDDDEEDERNDDQGEEDQDADNEQLIELESPKPTRPGTFSKFTNWAPLTTSKKKDFNPFAPAEHTPACNDVHRPSTPSPSPDGKRFIPPPDHTKDLSRNAQHVHKFHLRSLNCIPRLPLAAHRYWIGVLNVGESGAKLNNEKQFTWMRGNRLTTVETVWHIYAQTTVTEEFALLVAGGVERPEMGCRMEELDYEDDKRVIFRAVMERELRGEVNGQRVFGGDVPVEKKVEGKGKGKGKRCVRRGRWCLVCSLGRRGSFGWRRTLLDISTIMSVVWELVRVAL